MTTPVDRAMTGRGGVLLRVAAGLGIVLVATAVVGGLLFHRRLRASLPQLEGERRLDGLAAPVRVERDALGVPVVRGESRRDVARATGFLHAQERFFQMDLLRRRAAGELAELVGTVALERDREVRVLGLRAVARRAFDALEGEDRARLEAYAAGVNAGLKALGAAPFEYLLLRAEPRRWRPEDSGLCALAMFVTLQGRQAEQESARGVMHDVLPPELFEFLSPLGTRWDAPVEGGRFAEPPAPGPDVVDLRRGSRAAEEGSSPLAWLAEPPLGDSEDVALGSNGWAVAGTHTAHGGALLANDMHLGLAVPNVWYRAALEVTGGDVPKRTAGVMLPGVPFVVVGSNGRVAWAFTNSEGDWADLIVLEAVPNDPGAYLTPDGPRRLEHRTETIHVRGGEDQTLEVESTRWGPVVDEDHLGRRRALRWVPLVGGGFNLALQDLESVRDVGEALEVAATAGIPQENFVCADSSGHIGWTIMGRIPRRVGFLGRLPASWADGTRRWDGWLRPEEYPRIVDPPGGRIWTANARVVGGEALRVVGFGAYALGARAQQIRDDLMALEDADEAAMLGIQLDDRAVFLERWRRLLLEVLDRHASAGGRRAEARRWVEAWGGHASVDSVGYRIVRDFRQRVLRAALGPLLRPCSEADERLAGPRLPAHRQWEGPAWTLVTTRPPHLLDPSFESWEALLLAAADSVVEEMTDGGRPLAARTWGERNTVLIRHPLSSVAPGLGRWLDMTPEPLPGDTNMPRVQRPMAGASERLAVSPGREEHGYLHMPGGQSGHPLSPHYRDGNRAWARGEPTPFLPGPAVQILTLQPGTRMVRHRSRVHARSVEAQRRRGTGVRSLSRSSKTALRCPEGAPTRQRQGARGAAVRESERGRRGRHSVDQCEGTSPVRDASRPRGAPRGAKRLVRPWRAPQRGPRTVTPEASGDVPSDGHDPLSGTPRVIAGWPPSARGSRG